MTEIMDWRNEERFLPSGSNAVATWAHGLGPNQSTPSASTQAVPAPIVDRSTEFSTLIAWLRLTNQVMELPYDC
jgi:hypothetical protein